MIDMEKKNESDLSWLARNVHEWPKTDSYAVVWHEKGRVRVLWDCGTQNGESFTREQWLAERARLQNKPSWDDAPEWAMWLCQTSKGDWFFCESKQKPNADKGWDDVDDNDAMQCMDRGEVLGDWLDTLERRPKSMEPEQPEWKQDELPPIGEECEVYRNGEWELCEIIAHIEQPMGTIAVFSYGREPGYGISGVDCLIPRYFRPVDASRAEEDKAVEEMMQVIQNEYTATQAVLIEQACRRLHQSGYRKLDNPDASN